MINLLFFILKLIFILILFYASGVELTSASFNEKLENKQINDECSNNNNNGVYNYFWTLSKNGRNKNISFIFGLLKLLTIDEINNSLPKELWKELNNSDNILLEANYNIKKKIGLINIEERLQKYYNNNYKLSGLLKYFNWKELPAQWIFQGLIDLRAELEKRITNINESSKLLTEEIEQKGIKNLKKIIYLNNLTEDLCNYFPLLANNTNLMNFSLDKLLNEIDELINKQKTFGSWQRAIRKYKCGNFQSTDDLIGQEDFLKEYFDQVDLDNFRKTTNLLNKDLYLHRERIANKIIKNMENNPEKKLLIIVDAGHLIGENSLINILAEKGFILQQYNPLNKYLLTNNLFKDYSQEITKKEITITTINYLHNNNKLNNLIPLENRSIREEKKREKKEKEGKEENQTFLKLKLENTTEINLKENVTINKVEINNNLMMITTTINNNNNILENNNNINQTINTTTTINNNTTTTTTTTTTTIIINNNNNTNIIPSRSKKFSSFSTYLIFIITFLLIIIFICWIIYNNCFTSFNLKPPHIIVNTDRECNIKAANFKIIDEHFEHPKCQQQIWSITKTSSNEQLNNNNTFQLNNTITPPSKSTNNKSFSESTETSFIEENKNEDEKIENINNLSITTLEEGQQQQYLSTSYLKFSQTPKTQLNQPRMNISDKINNKSSEQKKQFKYNNNNNQSLLPIKESKREAPPPPPPPPTSSSTSTLFINSNIPSFNNNIKHKKLSSFDKCNDENENNLYATIIKSKNEEIPKEEEEKQIIKLNEYKGINYNYPLINEFKEKEIIN
ncbi:hypothetical protein Mgra_00006262 [Meloidogyne graminicola]|uniref:Uncharacterized protein n=1 Tax=Meloidogyne graminicola TaxID=189291 RepID=A0A8S9ZLE9_9BILA|nr:hypothetical protein Mgra_00006262 [Meloidogyne graminicola]